MPLTLVEPPYPDTEIDVIAVPAIGADPRWAFKHPQRAIFASDRDPPFKTIYDDVRRARVYLYTYSDPVEGDAIANYATELMKSVAQLAAPKPRQLHFAGHNTGGLVVKKALVLAKASESKLWNQVASSCFSVAFFGVPHYGSDVLSDEIYLQSVREVLCTPTPNERLSNGTLGGRESSEGDRLRASADRQVKARKWKHMEDQLRNELSADNREKLMQLSRDFAPLALGMRKIWTFVEAYGTNLKVLSGGGKEGEEFEVVELSIVDRRSATLSNFELHIGSEKVVPIDCEHGPLSRFGADADFDVEAFNGYIEELRSLIRSLRPDEAHDLSWIQEELRSEVHLFYESTIDGSESSIKLWSAYPSLHDLLRKGLRQSLNERLKEIKATEAVTDAARERSRSPGRIRSSRRHSATSVIRVAGKIESRVSGSTVPSEIRSKRRDKNASKMNDENEVASFQWLRGRRTRSDIEAQRQESKVEFDTGILDRTGVSTRDFGAVPSFVKTPPTPPLERSDSHIAETQANSAGKVSDLPSIVIEPPSLENDSHVEIDSNGSNLRIASIPAAHDAEERNVEPAKPIALPSKPETGPANWLHRPETLDESKESTPAKSKNFQVPNITSRRFRWIHIPCNSMLFVQKVFQTIAEEKKKPRMFENLLRPQAWAFKQHIARHDSPHARYMEPYFESLPVTASLTPDDSVAHDLQMVIYLPYLHWDNFGALCDRNALIKKRVRQQQPNPVDAGVALSLLLEPKLLWQYLFNSAGLPMHHRRSLDQYRYPTLRSTAARDEDQVLHKRTRPAKGESEIVDKFTDSTTDQYPSGKTANPSSFFLKSRRRSESVMQNRRIHRAGQVRHQDRSKVLMVDQLWCWVADGDTVLTCFTPKEERDGDPAFQPADLRNAIYNDVNGDARFATKCDNPYDFLALVVCNAVTVFLDNMLEKDLQVFRIFEDYISQLTEEQTESFKRFRDNHQDEMLGRLDRYSHSSKILVDSSNDLANYLELRDIEDELTTLLKLFNEQTTVIKSMERQWKTIMAQLRRKLSSRERLGETLRKIASYKTETDNMIADCRVAQDAYKTLLDMKQKQANVDEMWLARQSTMVAAEQGRAIMFFTIFTIVFLPLSFFTSFFGMNVREWSGQSTNLPIHTVAVLMGSISAALIVIALLLAFNRLIYQAASHFLHHGIYNVIRQGFGKGEAKQETTAVKNMEFLLDDKPLPEHSTADGDFFPMLKKRNTD